MNEFTTKVGGKIRLLRKNQGLSQELLAEKSDITAKYLGQIERGEVNASVKSLNKIAIALNIPLAEFFSFTSIKESTSLKYLLISEINTSLEKMNEKTLEKTKEIIKILST